MRRTRVILTLALMASSLLPTTTADAAIHRRPTVLERAIDQPAPRRGTAGSSFTTLVSEPFRVEGSPYEWTIEASQSRSGPGVPPDDPRLRIIADRRAASGEEPIQVHTWSFDLSAGSLAFNGELRQVALDTGLISGFGAIFMDLDDPGSMRSSRFRCPKTGDVVSTTATRRGVLRGSMTFFPGYDDPQMPEDVNISHVRASIERTKYTGNDCSYPSPCTPGKIMTGGQSVVGGGYSVTAGSGGGDQILIVRIDETVGAADVSHMVLAVGDAPVLATSSTFVLVMGEAATPFVDGGTIAWTKGAKEVEQTAKCRRTGWPLTMPSGELDLNLDSGAVTLAAPTTATFTQVERR